MFWRAMKCYHDPQFPIDVYYFCFTGLRFRFSGYQRVLTARDSYGYGCPVVLSASRHLLTKHPPVVEGNIQFSHSSGEALIADRDVE